MFLSGGRRGRLPDGFPVRMLTIRWFARTYGWTERQTADSSAEAIYWLPLVEEAAARAAETRARQHQR